eukprot:14054069-Ditylum_brightwellii.AAC.1
MSSSPPATAAVAVSVASSSPLPSPPALNSLVVTWGGVGLEGDAANLLHGISSLQFSHWKARLKT